jgi:hypothetical protein
VSDEKKVNLVGAIAQGMLLKKEIPIYPQDAKDARVSGTVVLQATIGTDEFPVIRQQPRKRSSFRTQSKDRRSIRRW